MLKLKKLLTFIRKRELEIFATFLLLLLTGAGTYLLLIEPKRQLQRQLTELVINIRTKIVNISTGCKKKGGVYHDTIKQENADRIELLDKLTATGDSVDIAKVLGVRARDQMVCYIKYNDILSNRNNVCKGAFYTETQMKYIESKLIYSLKHKSNEPLKSCFFQAPIDMLKRN